MKSWRTTAGGIVAILAAVLAASKAMLDNDPLTNPDWNALIVAIGAGFGLIFARDNRVSSEEAGVR